MRFVRFELRTMRMPFRFSFGHALATRRENITLLVTAHTDGGVAGYGEILPRPYLTGETPETAREAALAFARRALSIHLPDPPPEEETTAEAVPPPDASGHAPRSPNAGRSGPALLAPLFAALEPLYAEADAQGRTAAYAGVDVACVDAASRAWGIAGGRMFSDTPPASARLTGVLGYGGPFKTAMAARAFRALGFEEFKIKLGRPDDAARLAAARKVLGSSVSLRGDANGAWSTWSAEDATARRAMVSRYGLSSVEQPVPARAPVTLPDGRTTQGAEAMAWARQALDAPVMADESLTNVADARDLLAAGGVDLWNVRVGKVGGFSGARRMRTMALSGGVSVHWGVLVGQTAVLEAATRACGGWGDFAHMEYGFTGLLLKEDAMARPPSGWRGGGPPLGESPGLGVVPRMDAWRRWTIRTDVVTAESAGIDRPST